MLLFGEKRCVIPWGCKAHTKVNYYVLDKSNDVDLEWVPDVNGNVPRGAFGGGVSEEGEILYIGRFMVEGVMAYGKVHPSHKVCYVPHGSNELNNKSYEVLCFKTIPSDLVYIKTHQMPSGLSPRNFMESVGSFANGDENPLMKIKARVKGDVKITQKQNKRIQKRKSVGAAAWVRHGKSRRLQRR
ncbi:uncharacterized protein LOC121870618 isoform X2 [Homarus americanus]|nr:uncharacterized protein LOC121870618 isoform X2 [Homarus americanus]